MLRDDVCVSDYFCPLLLMWSRNCKIRVSRIVGVGPLPSKMKATSVQQLFFIVQQCSLLKARDTIGQEGHVQYFNCWICFCRL